MGSGGTAEMKIDKPFITYSMPAGRGEGRKVAIDLIFPTRGSTFKLLGNSGLKYPAEIRASYC